jgi:ComF family protein
MVNPFLSLWHLFFPRRCAVCGTCLTKGEEVICVYCNIRLPRTYYHLSDDNAMKRLFLKKMPVVRAAAYFLYEKSGNHRRILYELKYHGRKRVGIVMGRMMAVELRASGFFDGMDVMVPVPLHARRKRERGYNQSEWIARGIAEITSLPIDTDAVVRKTYTRTQTQQSFFERWDNVKDAFELRAPERFIGKHILIVDDVTTSGATITACADTLKAVEGVRISILTLAKVE